MVTRAKFSGTTRYTLADELKGALANVKPLTSRDEGVQSVLNDPPVKAAISLAEQLSTSEGNPALSRVNLNDAGEVTVLPLLNYKPKEGPVGGADDFATETIVPTGYFVKGEIPVPKGRASKDVFPAKDAGFTIPTLSASKPLGPPGHLIALALDGKPGQPLKQRNLRLVSVEVDASGQEQKTGPVPPGLGLTSGGVAAALEHQMPALAQILADELREGAIHTTNPARFKEQIDALRKKKRKR